MRVSPRFQEELDALRISGSEFARLNPKLAKYLAAESADPDVERVLEGLAFLTGKVRDKLDAEIPELDQSMIQLLWPQFLRPSPSFTLMAFHCEVLEGQRVIPAGSRIWSNLIDGVSCEFRTTSDCTVAPLAVRGSALKRSKAASTLRIDLQAGVPAADLGLDALRLWFCGDASTAQNLYLWTRRYLSEVRLMVGDTVAAAISAGDVGPGGFGTGETLLPITARAFRGYQLLQEYFTFPEKFYCVDLGGFAQACAGVTATDFSLEFVYERPLPQEVKLRADDVRLFCVPACNLFRADGEPLAIDHRKVSYPVRVQGAGLGSDVEVFSLDSVVSWHADSEGVAVHRVYPRFETFEHETENRRVGVQAYYREVLKPSGPDGGLDRELSFVLHSGEPWLPVEETLSVELTCFNRVLASELAVGDVCLLDERELPGVSARNVTRPSQPVFPPLDGALDWTLIANLSLNYMTLLDLRALTAIMAVYDALPVSAPRAELAARKRAEGMISLSTNPRERVLHGLPISGLHSVLNLREDCFQTEGDMYLFASVVAEFFRLYTTTNAFHELEVRGVLYGEVYQWPAMIGR